MVVRMNGQLGRGKVPTCGSLTQVRNVLGEAKDRWVWFGAGWHPDIPFSPYFWGFCRGSVLLQASFMIYSIINVLESVSGARTRICKIITVSQVLGFHSVSLNQ